MGQNLKFVNIPARTEQNYYLDYAATSPLLPAVKAAMLEAYGEELGNASSLHSAGQKAKFMLEEARVRVARLINAEPEEIIFVSGGTEANNTVMHIFAGQQIAVSAIEHPSIMTSGKYYAGNLEIMPVDTEGRINLNQIPLSANLISVMLANNEIGTIQPIQEMMQHIRAMSSKPREWAESSESHVKFTTFDVENSQNSVVKNTTTRPEDMEESVVKITTEQSKNDKKEHVKFTTLSHNEDQKNVVKNTTFSQITAVNSVVKITTTAQKLPFVHTDATQALGKIPIDVKALGVDYLTVSAHKIGGPVGIGALYVRKGAPFTPLMLGGHQEEGRRAGTANVAAAVGFGMAAKLAYEQKTWQTYNTRVRSLRDKLKSDILTAVPQAIVNTPQDNTLPHILNLSFPAVEGEAVQLYLDLAGVMVSTGSACAAGDLAPSPVMMALRHDAELAHGSVRFSLGLDASEATIDYVMRVLPEIIHKLQGISTIKN